ncbi:MULTISPECIES: protocatechuate 3,4-dioxygenase subunit alpha [unclassified Nocardioides]|uniref:protocatechuate 3,4-dioxygenase subunit alpha n=1 Tax=unclassified Nocardioides TaxID=2615069 RepID=UPI00266635BE|nr:protocatechuate 3,4-dioxygenase subunit alpha [Nocardioides sp. Arc9.136]WKN47034.1 protocatechuate 3,4-dioxygenase subunit alpha [Nocardioides sp. Arc9.136]
MPRRTATPGQTVGPFFHYALPYAGDRDLVAPGTPGSVLLHGTVTDGEGRGVQDALVEIWQADPAGNVVQRAGSLRRDGHTFTGWGRSTTDRTGRYTFTTLEPGSVDGRLPCFAVTVFARGLLDRLFTRAYLPLAERPGAGPDGLLRSTGDRAGTLLCERDEHGLRFDIALQGADETVFLTYPGHS